MLASIRCDDAQFIECRKNFTHGLRRRLIGSADNMAADIDTELYSPGEVNNQYVLQIQILNQKINIIRFFILNALNAAPQRRNDSIFSARINDPSITPLGQYSLVQR